MDVDLQDPPELLIEMKQRLEEQPDLDCVGTRRVTRDGEPPIRSFFARMFYKLINHISQVEMVDGARDFRLMRRPMVDAIMELSSTIVSQKGFLHGWDLRQNTSNIKMSSAWQERRHGIFGPSLSIRLKGLSISRMPH